MPIDLTDRIIQPPPKNIVRLHPLRRIAQVALGVVLVLLPLVNWLRVDMPAGRFWLFGQSFTAQNIIILFYGCAVGAVLLLSVSMVYGRWWCGWICPQTLASDFGDSLHTRLDHIFHATHSPFNRAISRATWSILMIGMAIATAAVVCTYFYPPARVWSSLTSPLADTRVALHLAIISLIIAADLLWVRRHFCRRGCPYGLMLSLIGDKNTMTVRYLWERDDDCIKCGKCVTVCPMDIDIKKGANQMECIGCGECIDACNDILPMIKANPKPGLIELRYGLDPMRTQARLTAFQRIGLWDTRRIFLASVSLLLVAGFFFQVYGTRPTTISGFANGSINYAGGYILEEYVLIVQNGRPHTDTFAVSIVGNKDIGLLDTRKLIRVARSASRSSIITIAAKIGSVSPGERYPITIGVESLDSQHDRHTLDAVFYVPEQEAHLKAGT